MKIYVEWWDAEASEWKLSRLPLWQYLYGRLVGVIASSKMESRYVNFRHVPKKDVIIVPAQAS